MFTVGPFFVVNLLEIVADDMWIVSRNCDRWFLFLSLKIHFSFLPDRTLDAESLSKFAAKDGTVLDFCWYMRAGKWLYLKCRVMSADQSADSDRSCAEYWRHRRTSLNFFGFFYKCFLNVITYIVLSTFPKQPLAISAVVVVSGNILKGLWALIYTALKHK